MLTEITMTVQGKIYLYQTEAEWLKRKILSAPSDNSDIDKAYTLKLIESMDSIINFTKDDINVGDINEPDTVSEKEVSKNTPVSHL